MMTLPIDVFPDLNRPIVTILTESGGLAPKEIEILVTSPIENAVSGLPSVLRVRSTSSVGLSIVWVEFDWGTDLMLSRQLVGEKLSTIRSSLPQTVTPQMGPISSLLGEIMLVGLRSESMSPIDLRSKADWEVKPRLTSVPGVSQIITIGGGVKQVHVKLDSQKMRNFKISLNEVKDILENLAQNTTGGFIESAYQEFLIRNISRPKTIEEIKSTVVSIKEGVPLKIKDIAKVIYSHQVKRGDAGINGKNGVILAIQKQPGVNTVDLTKKIEEELKSIRATYKSDIEVVELFKQATFIESAIYNVEEALRDGSFFVAIILFLFLMNLRTTAITLTAIPLSLILSFIVFKLLGISINTMTLGGLAVAIGELVDDAIVDVENVFRRLKENRDLTHPRPALTVIYEASAEVRNSIVIATSIVVLVFVPLFAMSGLEGKLFIPLGLAYVISILASLLISLTVTPVLCSYLLPKAKATAEKEDSRFVRFLKKWDKAILKRVLHKPKEVICVCAVLVSIAVAAMFLLGREFLPPFNEGTVTAFVVSPPGTNLTESNRIGLIAEKQLLKVPEVISSGRRSGRAEQDEHAEGVYNTEIDLELKESDRSKKEILANMREKLAEIPGIGVSLGQPISHRIDHMMSGVKAQIAIKIFGPDLQTLRTLASDIKDEISVVPGLVDLQVEKVQPVPQIQVITDAKKAARFGLTPGAVSEWLEEGLDGSHPVGEMISGLERTPIIVKFQDSDKQDIETLKNLFIDTPQGEKIPLHAVATVQRNLGPNSISHENARRKITVMANTQGRDLVSVVNELKKIISEKVVLPSSYSVSYGGQFESQLSATRSIALLSIFSIIAIFFVLYAYFKSYVLAFQILLNIPLALIGSVAAVYITGGVMSIGTLVGFITLCGIASRNGILMISHYLHLMKYEGENFTEQMVIKGSLERLVPVLMTALTATLALIPIALAGGDPGKEILHPVAVVILGGLLSSTLLDIFVTPVLFYNYAGNSVKKILKREDKTKGGELV